MNLRDERRKRGWTQEQLAALVGSDQTTISNLELGLTLSPSWPLVKRIADALDVEPEELFPVAAKKGEAA